MPVGIEREQRGEQRQSLAPVFTRRAEHVGEPRARIRRGVVGVVHGTLQLRREWVQRAALVKRRALVATLVAVAGGQFTTKLLDESRFADPGLTRDHDHLALARARPAPAFGEDREFLIAPRERRQLGAVGGLEAGFRAAFTKYLPGRHRRLETLHRALAERRVLEAITEQAARVRPDHDLPRRGGALQPCGEIRCIARHRVFLGTGAAGDVTDHHEPGLDTRAARQPFDARLRGHHHAGRAGDDLERAAGGTLGVVLVRLRITEVGEHAVAHVARDIAAVAGQHTGAEILPGACQAIEILRIETPREWRGADQVAEQQCQASALGPLAGGPGLRRRCRLGRGGLRRRRRPRRLEQPLAVAERDAHELQIGVVQIRQHVDVDAMLGEYLAVLTETLPVEPLLNARHRRAAAWSPEARW